jgi:hypothetical protein
VYGTVWYIDILKKVSVAVAILPEDFVEEFRCRLDLIKVLVTFGSVSSGGKYS